MADGILARVPTELDALNQEVVLTACIGLGFTVERPRGDQIFSIELGSGALVDGLPGVPGGSSYVGSFDRAEAVENETIDFFASGHPVVEGIFAHYRVARFEVEIGAERGEGLLVVYKDRSEDGTKNGSVFEMEVIDSTGKTRPDWAIALHRRPLGALRVTGDKGNDAGWIDMVRRLGLPCTHIQGWTNKLPPCSVTAWSTRTRYYRPFVRLSRKLASSELWRRRR